MHARNVLAHDMWKCEQSPQENVTFPTQKVVAHDTCVVNFVVSFIKHILQLEIKLWHILHKCKKIIPNYLILNVNYLNNQQALLFGVHNHKCLMRMLV
jgi:hypothetical protein